MYVSELYDFMAATRAVHSEINVVAGQRSNGWLTSWIYNTALLEGIGDELLKLEAPDSASGLDAAVRHLAMTMKSAGYNLRIGVVNVDVDALRLGNQQYKGIPGSIERIIPAISALCVPVP